MKKYMKPALMAVEFECKDKISINVSSDLGDRQHTKRLEEDEFLDDFLVVEDNPWKRNK